MPLQGQAWQGWVLLQERVPLQDGWSGRVPLQGTLPLQGRSGRVPLQERDLLPSSWGLLVKPLRLPPSPPPNRCRPWAPP